MFKVNFVKRNLTAFLLFRFQLIAVLLLASFNLKSQIWEGDVSKVGKVQPGGFDYQWLTFGEKEIGSRKFNFDYAGVRPIMHAPKPGIHPRIYFNPEELPELRKRLKTTANGKEIMKKIHSFNTLLHKGNANNSFDKSASYAVNDFNIPYINNVGAFDFHDIYYKLAKGDTSVYSDLLPRMNRFGSAISMEALECLIREGETDVDTKTAYNERAKNLASVLAILSEKALESGANAVKYNMFGGLSFPIAYDLIYNSMTEKQRNSVRKGIAAMIPSKPRYGSDVTPYATTGNWTTLNSFEVISNMAIEGEPGYKPDFTHLWMKANYNFISYGWYNSGCPWEGLGKNYMMVGQQIAFAKRGYSLLGHPHVRAFGNNYLPAIIQPFGYSFFGEDTWGGSGLNPALGKYKFHAIDAVGLKYAYPDDSGVDFVWRNYISEMINNKEEVNYAGDNMTPGSHVYFDIMSVLAAYSSDIKGGEWQEQNKQALKNKLDFFETERGLCVLRSDFSKDATSLVFYVRQNFGGHTYADRNDFSLSAMGRIWAPKLYGGAGYDETDAQSCILIDDKGMAITKKEGNKSRIPAKLEKWTSTNYLSQATGNATYAYSWEWNWDPQPANKENKLLGKDGWEKEMHTLNDFRAEPSSEAFFNIPFYNFAAWNSPDGYTERMIRRPYNPMEKVVRTVSMIKDKSPMVLIVDDIKKDNQVHNYKWVMQLPQDVEVESVKPGKQNNEEAYNVILKEKQGNRRLLVRVLSQTDYKLGDVPVARAEKHTFIGGNGKNSTVYRLVLESSSIAPDYKVLLFPYTKEASIPKTTWDKSKSALKIINADKNIKTISFSKDKEGSTVINSN